MPQSEQREHWTSQLGIVLAAAGSAVGLGNFLRFPGILAQNGGGTFLIPYFIVLLLVGLPMAWVEWTLGRYAGLFGHGAMPGGLNAIIRKPWAKYMGSGSIFILVLILGYYILLESWILGYVWYSITGALQGDAKAIADFFGAYTSLRMKILGMPAAIVFFFITLVLNTWITLGGIQKGVEKVSRILMPALILLSLVLLIRVLGMRGISEGLAFMWNPNFATLGNVDIWMAAAGQIFFTLNVGLGAIFVYASYLKRDDDVILSSSSAASINAFLEVIVGGTIIIPAAIVLFGISESQSISSAGVFGLGFMTMPGVLLGLPFARIMLTTWFALLFLAGITSSISIMQPIVTYMEDDLNLSRNKSVWITTTIALVLGLMNAYGLSLGVLDEMDFWAGNLGLVFFATFLAIIFAWVLPFNKVWDEMHRGADFRLPNVFRYVMKYVTPTLLIALTVGWIVQQMPSFILMERYSDKIVTVFGIDMPQKQFIAGVRVFLLAILACCIGSVGYAWKRNKWDEKMHLEVEDALHTK